MSRTGHLAMSGDKQREGILLASSGWRPRILLNIFQCVGQPDNKEFSWVHSLSRVQLFATPQTAARQASLSLPVSQSLPKFMFIASEMPSSHLILWCPLLLLPSIFPNFRIFCNELALCIKWPKYWSFSISPSNEYSGLISFRIGCLDLLAVQGTLKNLLQHHNSKESILWHSPSLWSSSHTHTWLLEKP